MRVIVAVALLFGGVMCGQVPAAPAFEAASIRQHTGPLHVIMGFSSSGPRLRMEGYDLELLLQEAFELKNYQLIWGPKVSPQSDVYYDIVAKAEGDAAPTKREFCRMLQTLLIERFHLKSHWETRELPVYALVVGKEGVRLKQSAADAAKTGFFGVHGRNQTISMPRDSMASLADQLHDSFGVSRPVVDRTGLAGTYDVQFEATPEFRMAAAPTTGDVDVFTAVQEQLGLKLVPAKEEVQVLVIDRMDAPSEN